MPVIAFPQAPSRPSRRRVKYPTIREQLAGLQRDLASAAAQTSDRMAEEEFVGAVKRLATGIKRMETEL
jgi:hypothetical protein